MQKAWPFRGAPKSSKSQGLHRSASDLPPQFTHSIPGEPEFKNPDVVFHLAAQSFPRTSFDATVDTYDTNVNGTTRLLEAIRFHKPDVIVHVCSSSEAFGRVPREKLPIDEECTFHPASPYAIPKAGTDLVGRFYAEAYGVCTVTTRMFTNTGPRRGDVFAESTFAKQIAMICGEDRQLRQSADLGSCPRRSARLPYVRVQTH